MTDFNYKFSIVMAVYNVDLFLDEAIQSLVKQTIGFEKNVQLILVDDGSTDVSGTICDRYAQNYPKNILVIHKENGGVSSARNAGIPFIQGKYVNFLDSDDKLTVNALSEVYDFFENNYSEIDVVSIPLKFFDGQTGGHILNYKFQNGTRVIDLQKEYECIQLSLPSAFIKQQDAKQICFDTRLHYAEDAKECLKILINRMKLGVVAEPSYLYRRRTQGEQSAIQKSGLTKDWYLEYIELFSRDVLDYSRQQKGFIPKFLQYSVIYDLQWRITTNSKKIKSILSEEEFKVFKKKLFALLAYIDDEVILTQSNIYPEHKCYLLSKKYDVTPYYLNCNKNLAVCVDKSFIIMESNIKTELDFMEEEGNDLVIEGIVYSLIPTDGKESNVFLHVDKQFISCATYRVPVKDVLCLDDIAMCAIGFKGVIKKYKQYPVFNVNIFVDCQGIRVQKQSLRTGPYFPVTASVKNAYAYQNGYIFSFEKNCFKAYKAGINDYIKHEITFLKQLKRINSKPTKKAFVARCAYHIAKWFKRKPIWLLSDRINKADDNGEALFKYLSEKKVPENLYFVIRKDSADYNTVKKYGKVLNHFSKIHKFMHLLADATVSAAGDAYVTRPYGPSSVYYQDILTQQKHVFLQHGIIKDDLSDWLNKYSKNLDMFVTSAIPEYQSILSCAYYYDEKVVKLTGLPRYDRLYDNKKRIITIMPTWRGYLTQQNNNETIDGIKRYDETFKETTYFKFYDELLNSKKLIDAAIKCGYSLQFMPHPNLINFVNWFRKNENVTFCSIQTKYRQIFAESALVVTDYSSVAFDFAYLRKPVVYCQFDREEFFENHTYTEGYFDYERDGFGEVTYNQEDLINCLIEYMKNDCKLKGKFKHRMENFFAFNDRNNCERVYEEIIKLF